MSVGIHTDIQKCNILQSQYLHDFKMMWNLLHIVFYQQYHVSGTTGAIIYEGGIHQYNYQGRTNVMHIHNRLLTYSIFILDMVDIVRKQQYCDNRELLQSPGQMNVLQLCPSLLVTKMAIKHQSSENIYKTPNVSRHSY